MAFTNDAIVNFKIGKLELKGDKSFNSKIYQELKPYTKTNSQKEYDLRKEKLAEFLNLPDSVIDWILPEEVKGAFPDTVGIHMQKSLLEQDFEFKPTFKFIKLFIPLCKINKDNGVTHVIKNSRTNIKENISKNSTVDKDSINITGKE